MEKFVLYDKMSVDRSKGCIHKSMVSYGSIVYKL